MSIYTRFGDAGYTRDAASRKVPKDSPSVCVLGELDELNAHIGCCVAACGTHLTGVSDALRPVQEELFMIGAMVSDVPGTSKPGAALAEKALQRMEGQIDQVWAQAGALNSFLVPAGGEAACRLHVARTVCRRAERALVSWSREADTVPSVLAYLNRLSDLLFALARHANHVTGRPDRTWRPGREG
jgi:cob(I)alamin adenosyltransferase